MNTYLVASRDPKKALDEIENIYKKHKVSKFDIEILEFEKSLGIEDVSNIQKKIFLKPLKGEKKTTIIVMRSGATVEAQNSMLKLLEEPPISSLIFLVTDNAKVFLPTVLSRVKVIEIVNDEIKLDDEGLETILSLNSEGDRLYLAQVVTKEKTEAIVWLEKTILAARQKMLENLENKQEALKLRKIIHQLELTHYDLKTTNANHRLALENLFLNLN